jgi:hypothetical protein
MNFLCYAARLLDQHLPQQRWLCCNTPLATQMPNEASWAAMSTLHRELGLRFIIGLPLNNNNEQLMAAMVRKARQVLPAAAIAGFELGNEPMYWEVCPDVKIGAVSGDAQATDTSTS